jgi:hypothetical protein
MSASSGTLMRIALSVVAAPAFAPTALEVAAAAAVASRLRRLTDDDCIDIIILLGSLEANVAILPVDVRSREAEPLDWTAILGSVVLKSTSAVALSGGGSLTKLRRRSPSIGISVSALWLIDCYRSAQERSLPSDNDTHLAPFVF